MIEIDGSWGEGGGQVLRSSLTLSMMTAQPVHLVNIRARRPKPGLQPQHLAAVRAAATISGADVEGGAFGSSELTFIPGAIRPGIIASTSVPPARHRCCSRRSTCRWHLRITHLR